MNDPVGLLTAILVLSTGVMYVFFTDKCYKKTTPEQAERNRKILKRCGYLFLPGGLILLACYFTGGRSIWVDPGTRQHARRVIKECMAATEVLNNSPPGFARADEFIRRIRAIDTRGAPEDLVDALHADADALERSIAAARGGKDTKELDGLAAAAKERFAKKVKKYW